MTYHAGKKKLKAELLAYHLSDEELVHFIDNELSPSESDRMDSHLTGCSKCHSEYKELLSSAQQFEQLLARAIPVEFPKSDLYTVQLRRRLAQVPVIERRANSPDDNVECDPETSEPPAKESQPDKTNTHSFKLLKLPQRVPRFRTSTAYSVTYAEGDKLYREGLRAYLQGSMDQAVEYWREAKMVFLRLDCPREIAACDRNVADAQMQLGQSTQALEQLRKAKDLFKSIGELQAMNSCELKIRRLLRDTTGHTWG